MTRRTRGRAKVLGGSGIPASTEPPFLPNVKLYSTRKHDINVTVTIPLHPDWLLRVWSVEDS